MQCRPLQLQIRIQFKMDDNWLVMKEPSHYELNNEVNKKPTTTKKKKVKYELVDLLPRWNGDIHSIGKIIVRKKWPKMTTTTTTRTMKEGEEVEECLVVATRWEQKLTKRSFDYIFFFKWVRSACPFWMTVMFASFFLLASFFWPKCLAIVETIGSAVGH